jgi:integrase|tara:strand:+ start:763 stop:1881 length:1119 start_codon:yes stop_codon:yes gene_type:complete
MAYIEKTIKNNLYRIRWRDSKTGKLECKTFTGTRKEVEKECRYWSRIEHEIKSGIIVNRVNMEITLGSLKKWFFGEISGGKRRNAVGLTWKNMKREKPLDEKTIAKGEVAFNNFIRDFGENYPIESLSSIDYRKKNPDRKLSGLNVDIRAIIAVINTAIKHKDRLINRMPSELFQFTVEFGVPFYLEAEDVNTIMNADMDEFYKNKPWDFDRDETMRIFMLYMQTGCRLNELLGLTWDRVDFVDNSITVIGKRKKVRKIFVTKMVMSILMEISDRERPLPYTHTKVKLRLNDLNEVLGKKFTAHNLRSTCGSFMLSAGCSIEEVSEHLGHEDIQTTRKWYARIIEVKRKEAVSKMEGFTLDIPKKNFSVANA